MNAIVDLYLYQSYEYVYDRSFHPDLQANTSVEELEQLVLKAESRGPLKEVITDRLQPNVQGLSVFLFTKYEDTDEEYRQEVQLVGSAEKGYKITAIMNWEKREYR